MIDFVSANSADLDEMPPLSGIFTVCHSTHLEASSPQRARVIPRQM